MTTVLIVDDSAVDRRLARGLLERHSGVQVSEASHGREALDQLHSESIDLVLTDLQMPEMDGLELVDAVRAKFPKVPVILMTGKGSEETAVTALQRGAASYVPKSLLAGDLVSTVMHVLAVGRSEASTERMMAGLTAATWEFELENDYTLIAPLVALAKSTLAGMEIVDETGQVQVGVALEEAVSNAMYHGNLELTGEDLDSLGYDLHATEEPNAVDERRRTPPYCDRRVRVKMRITRHSALFEIADEGPGFDVSSLPGAMDQVASGAKHGRGLAHIQLFMDDVRYNEKGNQVTLIKNKR